LQLLILLQLLVFLLVVIFAVQPMAVCPTIVAMLGKVGTPCMRWVVRGEGLLLLQLMVVMMVMAVKPWAAVSGGVVAGTVKSV
jgi:hypothetical protein